MLLGLKIENIAVIENASLQFAEGFNALTGETGAGKSIVIDSINAILGDRVSKDIIRNGSDSGKVIASFVNISKDVEDKLDELGIDKTDDNSLTISRSLSLSGKNNCRVNGWPVTVSVLKELGDLLINIHGQHDSQSLLNPDKHCGFIDSLADNEALRIEYKNAFHNLISVKKELDSLYDSRDEKLSKLDYLNFVISELTEADIKIGEIEELNKEKNLLQNSAKVKKILEKAYLAIGSDGGMAESLAECAADVEKAAEYYENAGDEAKHIKGLAIELSDSSASLRRLLDSFSYSPSRLTEIDDRLDVIYRLSMKYGKTEEDMLNVLDNSLNEKETIDGSDKRIEELENELYKLSDIVKNLAKKLTESRKKTASEFEKEVGKQLSYLDMPYVNFIVSIKETPLSSKGAESIEFLISVNPGQEPKPISKIASGGELSRIMLAIKNVLSDKDNIDTLIFDEIDAGVSGSAAEKIAFKLDEVSRGRQVICVTHLARIAAQADNHMKIEKQFSDGSTFTKVIQLDFDGRANELARITAGNNITDLQLETAKEMLKSAKEIKQ